ncbi:RhtB (resistance to homoserine/threonine) family protein [Nocardia pseudobrasiliensis]|uniref:RhtB (Resistance to homoserine/threonine) family protein n=2 Tax=Nocardia pseudobrasiliensis TaxID=45979 RepID=A0A370ICG9_9NOCA|nr:RhtB (resistance to homoserine/threonine) family protein [Nocardia pseudobrasiliensis]
MSTTQTLGVAGVMLLGAMAPGPDFVIVTRHSLMSGRRAGMACGAGIALGVFVWAALTGVGVAGLLAASAIAFTVVKLIGAVYLLYLGVRALMSARRGDYETATDTTDRPTGLPRAFRQGLLNNLFNPKVAVFFVALLPQFLPATPTGIDALEIGVVTTSVTLAWFMTLAIGIATLRQVFLHTRVRRTIDTVLGALLVGLGVRIALQNN